MTNRTSHMAAKASPARSRSPFARLRGMGGAVRALTSASARTAAPSKMGASGSRRACTRPSRSTRSTRVVFDWAVVALNQTSARLFAVPPSLGVEVRILNGYVYISANSVTDEETLARRAELFEVRGGHYYEHWDELYERWVEKVEAATAELQTLDVPELPEFEDESVVTEGRGVGSSYRLLAAYDRLLEGLDRVLQYHFEFLNLGYGAYLAFYELCRSAFPDIDDQTLAKMVAGIDVLVLRPDDELKRLAGLARRARGRRPRPERHERERSFAPPSPAARRARAGWPTSTRPRTPGSTSPAGSASSTTTTARGSTTRRSRSRRSARTSSGSRPARTSPGPTAAVVAERERITAEYRALLPEEQRAGLRPRAWRSPGPSSRTSRTTTSTSTTGTSRSSGTRCASSAPCSHAHGFLAERGGRLLPPPRRGPLGARGAPALSWSSGGAGAARGPAHWPPTRRAAEVDLRGDAAMVAAARTRPDPRRDHRADHDHALGDHHRARPGVAVVRRRRRGRR